MTSNGQLAYLWLVMTPFEKFVAALIVLYFASHAALKLGRAAGVPAVAISLAEWLVTA